MIITKTLHLNTKGSTDIVDITGEVERGLTGSKLKDGSVTVFVAHSTAAVTAIECEPGLLEDFRKAWERIVPRDISYSHDSGLGEGNGYSHVRASILGPSLSVPFTGGKLALGTWQQIVIVDFDNRPRSRTVVLQFVGE
jgi:secondary thiamine-phosphate synthase enzyme